MEEQKNRIKRIHFFFTGRVQGVGFRYTAIVYAQRLGLSGWVKNTPDGRVEMEVQGSRERIDLLTDQLAHSVPIRIDHVQEWPLPLVEGEKGFREYW